MATWFTSDQHFSHKRILYYEAFIRKFSDVREMDDAMIKAWNSIVEPEDLVYHIGDFALCAKTRKREIMSQLNGAKILIKGNHDASSKSMLDIGFKAVYKWTILKLMPGDIKVLLIHNKDKIEQRLGSPKDYDHVLCGHVHSKWLTFDLDETRRAVNVGVDYWRFQPVDMRLALATANITIPYDFTLTTHSKESTRKAKHAS